MAFKVAEGFVELQPKIDKGEFQRKVRDTVRDSTKGVQPEADKGGTGIGKSFAAGFAGALSVDVVKGALGAIVGGASDLNETMSKSNVVFGDNSEQIHRWAKNAEQSMGLSQQAAESNANGLGLLFTQVGLGTQAASKMSQSWVQLAVDLGSFNNADPTEILIAMQAATRGEYDSLQQFVPMINAAAVEQKALALSGKASNKELNEQDKLLAINALMFEQTGAAQGDFARTSEGVANQAKIMKAELENSAAAVGSALLPALSGGMSFITGQVIPTVREMGNVFGSLPPPVQAGLASMAILLVTGPPIVSVVRNITQRVTEARIAWSAMTTAGKVGAGAFGALGIAVVGVTGVIASFANQQAEAKRKVEDLSATLDAQTGKVTADTRVWALDELRKNGAADAAQRLGIRLEDLVAAGLDPTSTAGARVNAILSTYQTVATGAYGASTKMDAGAQRNASSAELVRNALSGQNNQLDESRKKKLEDILVSKGAADENKALGGEHKTAADKAAEQAAALQELLNKLTALGRMTLSESEAQIAFQGAIDKATESIDKNGKTLNVNTEKGRANQGALNDIVNTTLSWVESGVKAGVSQGTLNQRMNAGAIAYQNAARALKMPQAEIDAYTKKVFGVPASRITKLNADKRDADNKIRNLQRDLKRTHDKKTIAKITADIRAAQAKRRQIQREIDALRDRNILINIYRKTYYQEIYSSQSGDPRGKGGRQSPGVPRAAGGPVFAGMLYQVNEKGDEALIPAMDGTIIPHHQLQGSPIYASPLAAAGGGGVTYTGPIYVSIPVQDVREFKEVTDLLSAITQTARTKPFANGRRTGRG
jgi:hypothetical protein